LWLCACFLQAEASNDVETAANDIQLSVEVTEVTGGHMRPVVRLEMLDLTR